MRGKIRRPSGDCAIFSRDLVGGDIGDVVPVEQNPAGAGARPAENRHHQRRLAGTVGASATISPALISRSTPFSASIFP